MSLDLTFYEFRRDKIQLLIEVLGKIFLNDNFNYNIQNNI